MAQFAVDRVSPPPAAIGGPPQLDGEMRQHLGCTLREVYERTLDTQPIPDSQVDLLLQLRHKERNLQRAG